MTLVFKALDSISGFLSSFRSVFRRFDASFQRTRIETDPMRLVGCVLIGVLTLGTAGCSSDEPSLVAAALERLDKDDYAGAEIEVRNLLSLNQRSAQGRFVLAKVLMALGDLTGAEQELDLARTFGCPVEQLAPLMAELLIEQGRSAEAIARYGERRFVDAQATAELYTQLARAHLVRGDASLAEARVAAALELVPDFAPALIVRARIAGAQGKLDAAVQIARQLTESQSTYAPAWLLLGDVARSRGDQQSAVQAYRKALQLRPKLVPAHSGLITLYQRLRDTEGMKEHVAAMRRLLPGNPTTFYYEALLAYNLGDFAKARERLQPLLQHGASQVEIVYLAGLTEIRLGDHSLAERLLSRAAALAPNAIEPVHALTELYARMGDAERALAHIKAFEENNPGDAAPATLLGTLHALNGDFHAAGEAFERAAKVKPDDARLRASLGRTMIARGMVERGLSELQAAAALDSGSLEHEIALVAFHMRRNQPDAALKVVDEMLRKQPSSGEPHYVRGRILQATGDLAGAKSAYDAAVAKDPRHLGAVSSLAELDIVEERVERARERYAAYLELEPRSAKALLSLAALARRTGASRAEVADWIERAIGSNPGDPTTWRQAIEFHQRDGNRSAALSLAQRANGAIRDNAELLLVLASAQLASGEAQQAITTLTNLVRLQPKSLDAHILLGLTQMSVGNLPAARSAIDSATELAPEWPPVLRARITLAIAVDEDVAKARAIAAEQQATHPRQALGWQLEGEIEGGQRNWPVAIDALKRAIEKEPSTHIARQLHDAMMQAGRRAEADAHARRWLASRPRDAEFSIYLSETALKQKDFVAAEAHLRQALKTRTKDPVLLNNLAMVQLELKQPEALDTAQRAVKLAPYHPALLDTLARAQAAHSDLGKAIETQARAVELKPESSAMRLNLARYYIAAKKNDKAKEQLGRLTHPSTPSAERDAAEELLAEMGR